MIGCGGVTGDGVIKEDAVGAMAACPRYVKKGAEYIVIWNVISRHWDAPNTAIREA